MRRPVQTVGFVLVLMGVSGTIDHLFYQPILGPFLNAFNRYVFPSVEVLSGYELYANLMVAVVGVVVIVVAERVPVP
jgi:predicted membrane-bound mannosyltransferase